MKKALRLTVVVAAVAALFLIACSSMSVSYDFDPDIDFQEYQTYRWMRTTSERLGVQKNSLTDKHIRKNADFHIAQTGLKKAEGETDLLVVYYVAVKRGYQVSTVGYAYGPYWGTSGVSVTSYNEGTLILDFVDREEQELVWRGVAAGAAGSAATNPQELDAKLDGIFFQMLANYPPPVEDDNEG